MTIIPEDTDDLTFWSDPVTRWACNVMAFWVGAVVCVGLSMIR